MWEGGNDVWRFANDILSESLWEINLMHLENITEFLSWLLIKQIFWELYVCLDSDQKVEVWSYKPEDRESILEN